MVRGATPDGPAIWCEIDNEKNGPFRVYYPHGSLKIEANFNFDETATLLLVYNMQLKNSKCIVHDTALISPYHKKKKGIRFIVLTPKTQRAGVVRSLFFG